MLPGGDPGYARNAALPAASPPCHPDRSWLWRPGARSTEPLGIRPP